MMRIVKSKAAVLVGLVLVLFLAIPSTTALAATALMVGGLGQTTLDDFTMGLALNGKFKGTDPESRTPWRRVNVAWPAQMGPYFGKVSLKESVDAGTASLVKAIKDTYNARPGEPITVLGSSAGALVVDEAMRVLAKDPTAPPISAVKFIVMADATQKNAGQETASPWNPWSTLSGYTYSAPPVTKYDLTVINYEFDGWADFPDRWWNGVAVANAMAGGVLLHAATWLVDLPTADAVKTVKTNAAGGLTTTYLVRAETLPLVQLIPSLRPMEAALRQQVEAGYSRYDSPTLPGLRSVSTQMASQTEATAQALVGGGVADVVDSTDKLDDTEAEDAADAAKDAVDVALDGNVITDSDAAAASDEADNSTEGTRSSRVTESRDSRGISEGSSAVRGSRDDQGTTRVQSKKSEQAEARRESRTESKETGSD